ncbi:MAG: hypothetical protein Q7I89_09265 [Syntrophales bacterium]|nr:hypothetical protein [Syntrophales bacterium]
MIIEQVWHNMLAADELEETLVTSHEVDDVVSLMVEFKIDPQKFGGNLCALMTRGMPTMADLFGREKPSLPTTPSVNQYVSIVNRPIRAPLWLLAGFPDVLAWLNDKQEASLNPSVDQEEAANAIAELFGFDVDSSEDMSKSDIKNPDGSLRACYYFNLVRNYIVQTGRSLEVAVEEGSEGNIYLGSDFLQMIGEESNFTLIATMTTKYYIELKARYASSFPDETSLLAMSGILDANFYIFGTGQLQPTQILDLAKATHGEKDRLLEFMIQFEALLLSVDTPELSPDEVLDACRNQAKAIQRSIRSAMETYRGEARIADDARALMTSTQFSHLRNAAGVRTPTLFGRLKKMILG